MAFEDAGLGNPFAENSGTFCAVNHVTEKAPTTGHVPPLGEQPGAIRKMIFNCIMIEQLVRLRTDLPAALALSPDRPGSFNPAAHVDVVDEPVQQEAAVEPREAVEIAKKFGSDSSSKFINGVLGSIVKKHFQGGKND